MISIVQLRKSFLISVSLAFVGTVMALILSFGTSAQQTLFTNDFEDGNANGWSKSGGRVVEPSDYYGYSLQNASDIKTIVKQGAGVSKIGF